MQAMISDATIGSPRLTIHLPFARDRDGPDCGKSDPRGSAQYPSGAGAANPPPYSPAKRLALKAVIPVALESCQRTTRWHHVS
jgi:hypothetical protein